MPTTRTRFFDERGLLGKKGVVAVGDREFALMFSATPSPTDTWCGGVKLQSEGRSGGIPDRARSTRRAVENSERSSTSPRPDSAVPFGLRRSRENARRHLRASGGECVLCYVRPRKPSNHQFSLSVPKVWGLPPTIERGSQKHQARDHRLPSPWEGGPESHRPASLNMSWRPSALRNRSRLRQAVEKPRLSEGDGCGCPAPLTCPLTLPSCRRPALGLRPQCLRPRLRPPPNNKPEQTSVVHHPVTHGHRQQVKQTQHACTHTTNPQSSTV